MDPTGAILDYLVSRDLEKIGNEQQYQSQLQNLWTTPIQNDKKLSDEKQNDINLSFKGEWNNKGFLQYIKRVESSKGPVLSTNSKDANSPEGGLKTVCWGHKLTKEEQNKTDYTYKECEDILLNDLKKAEKNAREYIRKNYGKEFDDLDQNRQEMLIDLCFNLGGLQKFPKFVTALMQNDYKTMAQQYKRYYFKPNDSTRYEIKDRNEQFYYRFIEPNL